MPQVKTLKDNTFVAEFKNFYQGFSPLAHLDSLTEKGNEGHASTMVNADILDGILTQGPGLENLTSGNENGAVTELIRYILDIPTSDGITYGIGTTKLFQITPTAVTANATFPHAITNCTEGSSVAYLKGVLYYFYNLASSGGCGTYDLASTFTDNWSVALQKAPHPVATKEDIMLFGNGRYVGTFFDTGATLDVDKLDFGTNHEVADIIYSGNYWYVAVNGGITGTNKSTGQIYLYDGAAIDSVLADEAGVGPQRIGFMYLINGAVFVAYQDLTTTGGYSIGYIVGRQIKKLGSFTGSLPTFAQKTLFKSTILFLAGGNVWSSGAVSEELPYQVSQIADGGYATCGAIASPFGTPMVASTDNTHYRLAKFSGYDTNSSWKSVIVPTTFGRKKGYIDEITILTRALGENAAATLTVEANQGATTSSSKTIETTGKTRHIFTTLNLGDIEDFRACISFSNGNTTNPCKIRAIQIKGHWAEL